MCIRDRAWIASLHATSRSFAATNWEQIVRVYDALLQVEGSAVVALNRAVAVSFADSPQAGLDAIEPLRGDLDRYVYLHSTRAELLRRLGRTEDAGQSYRAALACGPSQAERTFLHSRLTEIAAG